MARPAGNTAHVFKVYTYQKMKMIAKGTGMVQSNTVTFTEPQPVVCAVFFFFNKHPTQLHTVEISSAPDLTFPGAKPALNDELYKRFIQNITEEEFYELKLNPVSFSFLEYLHFYRNRRGTSVLFLLMNVVSLRS